MNSRSQDLIDILEQEFAVGRAARLAALEANHSTQIDQLLLKGPSC